MVEVLTALEEEAAFEQYVRNKREIQRLTEENSKIAGYYRDREPLGKREVGKFYIQVSPNNRIDEALAVKFLTDEDWDQVGKVSIDTRKARAVLPPEKIEWITKVFEPKIEIGLN